MIVIVNMGLFLLLSSYSLIHGQTDFFDYFQIILLTITAMNFLYVIKTVLKVNSHSYLGNSYGYRVVFLPK